MDDSCPTGAGWRLSLVIPAYNEAAVIRQAIAEADEVLARLTTDYEVLVVDDGSGDDTAALVEDEAKRRPHVRLLRHEKNRGYGAALRTGFEAASFPLVAFTDADCQFYLDDLSVLLPLTDATPIAAGFRVARQDTRWRRFISWGYNTTVRTLLGTRVRDCDCALKVFRREALAELLPESSSFFVNTEMLARARQHGFRVAEAGVRHRPRANGVSKVSVRDVPRVLRTLLPFWWSQVLFPGQAEGIDAPESAPRRTDWISKAAILTLLAVLLFFSRLGTALQEPQEAYFAEAARQSLTEGHWAVPSVRGEAYPDKPPLLCWLVMLSYSVFGVHDWAARLIPGAAGVATVLLAYFWGRRMVGALGGFVGALLLCLAARFVYLERLLTTDSLLTVCVIAALATGHVAVSNVRRSFVGWLLSALACGIGLLTKGPVVLALVLPPLLLLTRLDPRIARPSWRHWFLYLGVACGIAAPWYALAEGAHPGYLADFFWRHHALRFTEPFNHREPVWFYLPGLLLGLLPGTLLLPALVRFLTRHSHRVAERRPAALGFFLLSFVWGLLFFSASGCKRATYILPLMPPLALALGCYLEMLLGRILAARAGSRLARRGATFARRLTQIVLGVGIALSLLAIPAGLLKLPEALFLSSVALGGLFLASRPILRNLPAMSWGLGMVATFTVLFLGVQTLLPGYARKFALRGTIRPLAEVARAERLPVVSYPRRWDSVSFYLQREDVQTFTTEQRPALIEELRDREETLVFVKSGKPLDELLGDLPPSREFVVEGRQGTLTVGRVRWRREVPLGVFAHLSVPAAP